MGDDILDLSDRVAVVTGGSRGLGRCIALALAAHGAHVLVASRKPDACESLAAEISATTGRRSLGLAFHAGQWGAAEQLMSRVMQEFGTIDVLINNAGMSPLYDSPASVSEELFDKVLAVNLRGPFRLSVLAAEHMAHGSGGSIVNVSSIAAVQPSPNELVYAAAKAALNTLTIGIANTYGPRVRANVIMPGPFLTDVAKHWDMEAFEGIAETSIPLGRAGDPEEIVGAALYLASDASSYTTGSILKVDGGATRSIV